MELLGLGHILHGRIQPRLRLRVGIFDRHGLRRLAVGVAQDRNGVAIVLVDAQVLGRDLLPGLFQLRVLGRKLVAGVRHDPREVTRVVTERRLVGGIVLGAVDDPLLGRFARKHGVQHCDRIIRRGWSKHIIKQGDGISFLHRHAPS